MLKYFIIFLLLLIVLIFVGTLIGLHLNNSKYFDDVIKDKKCPEIKFFIKKHTIFRFFSLFYAVVHYFLNIVSVISSFITVYMIMDDTISLNTQLFFLLTAAITSNFVLGLRIDKISESYAQAMRILEKAILKYLMEEKIDIKILYEANEMAEQYISNKFF